MKIPLAYQKTEYDCAPTSLYNGISYLFDREEIPPGIIKPIAMYTMDSYNRRGESCKMGTSRIAMQYITNWLNHFATQTKFPLAIEYIQNEDICVENDCYVGKAVRSGSVAVVRLFYEQEHYALITKIQDDMVYMFDPHYRYICHYGSSGDIELVKDKPKEYNSIFTLDRLNSEEKGYYMMGPKKNREIVLMHDTRINKPKLYL